MADEVHIIVSSSTIDKKLEIYTKLENKLEIDKKTSKNELEIDKELENFESIFEIFVNFEFLLMVDEVAITMESLCWSQLSRSQFWVDPPN